MTDWRNPKTNDAFLEWRNTFPEQHWSKNDLSVCRLGFDAGYAAGRDEGLEEAAKHLEHLAKETPLGQVSVTQGSSTYNWLTHCALLIRDAAALRKSQGER